MQFSSRGDSAPTKGHQAVPGDISGGHSRGKQVLPSSAQRPSLCRTDSLPTERLGSTGVEKACLTCETADRKVFHRFSFLSELV